MFLASYTEALKPNWVLDSEFPVNMLSAIMKAAEAVRMGSSTSQLRFCVVMEKPPVRPGCKRYT